MIRPAIVGCLLASFAVTGAAPVHAAGGRLDKDVVPTSQAVRLALDARTPDYRGAVRSELRVDRQTDIFRFHSEGLTLNAFKLTGGGNDYQVAPGEEQHGMVTVRTTPALGSTSRFTILSVVVLPQPERPSSTRSSPRATSKLSRSTARVSPKRRVSSRTSIRAPFTRRTLPHGVDGTGPRGERGA